MSDHRIIASVTWGRCPKVTGRPHLAEMILYEGAELNVDEMMKKDHYSLWQVREFICMYCGAHNSIAPTAMMIVDVRNVLKRPKT